MIITYKKFTQMSDVFEDVGEYGYDGFAVVPEGTPWRLEPFPFLRDKTTVIKQG